MSHYHSKTWGKRMCQECKADKRRREQDRVERGACITCGDLLDDVSLAEGFYYCGEDADTSPINGDANV